MFLIKNIDDWNTAFQNKNNILLFNFTASWCGPCKKLKPELITLSRDEKYSNVVFYKVDIDECEEIANICFAKSVYALRTIRECLGQFINNEFIQIYIIKMNEVWNMLKFFFPVLSATTSTTKQREDDLRMLFSLELLTDLTRDPRFYDFFKRRLEEDIWPLLEKFSLKNNDDEIKIKIVSLATEFVYKIPSAPETLQKKFVSF